MASIAKFAPFLAKETKAAVDLAFEKLKNQIPVTAAELRSLWLDVVRDVTSYAKTAGTYASNKVSAEKLQECFGAPEEDESCAMLRRGVEKSRPDYVSAGCSFQAYLASHYGKDVGLVPPRTRKEAAEKIRGWAQDTTETASGAITCLHLKMLEAATYRVTDPGACTLMEPPIEAALQRIRALRQLGADFCAFAHRAGRRRVDHID